VLHRALLSTSLDLAALAQLMLYAPSLRRRGWTVRVRAMQLEREE